ncbi:hypothetical protein HDU93_005050 [Gonapodya sp. JEL0774]|nr:hypothetical protein HDU93_005050 [Gonapodya sp. JEL0774]
MRDLYHVFRLTSRNNSLASQYPGLTAEQVSRIFTNFTTDDLDFCLHWVSEPTSTLGSSIVDISGQEPTVQGMHFIIGINLSVQQSPISPHSKFRTEATEATARVMYAETARLNQLLKDSLLKNKNHKDISPVRVILKAKKSEWKWNFATNGFLVVPVDVQVVNCSWNTHVKFELHMLPTEEQTAGDEEDNPQGPSDFVWSGVTSAKGYLGPGEDSSITMTVTFLRGGVFNINRWKLLVTADHEGAAMGGRRTGVEKTSALDVGEAAVAEGLNPVPILGEGDGAAEDDSKSGYLQTPVFGQYMVVLGETDS